MGEYNAFGIGSRAGGELVIRGRARIQGRPGPLVRSIGAGEIAKIVADFDDIDRGEPEPHVLRVHEPRRVGAGEEAARSRRLQRPTQTIPVTDVAGVPGRREGDRGRPRVEAAEKRRDKGRSGRRRQSDRLARRKAALNRDRARTRFRAKLRVRKPPGFDAVGPQKDKRGFRGRGVGGFVQQIEQSSARRAILSRFASR